MKWLLTILGAGAVVAVLGLLGLGARDGRGRVTGAVELDHPPSVVFPLLVQPPLRKQWLLGVQEISPVGDPTLRSGARSRVMLDVPEQMEVEEEIRVVEADRRVLLQRSSSHPPFNQRLEYVLKDLGGGRTLVTVAVHTIYQGLAMNLAEPLLTRAAQTQMDQEIEQLRTAVGSAQTQAQAAAALPVVTTPTVAVGPPPTPAAPPSTVIPAAVPPSPAPATAPPPAIKPPQPPPITQPAARPPEPPPATPPPDAKPPQPPPEETAPPEPQSDPASTP